MPGDELTRLVERYWGEYRALNPLSRVEGPTVRFDAGGGYDISPQFLADSLALERRYLEAVGSLPRASLNADSQLVYDVFKRQRELAVTSFTYPSELFPINPFRSLPTEFAEAATYAVSNAEDYHAWAARADAFVRWDKQAIDNLRAGSRRGYALPAVLVQEMLPMLAELGTDSPDNVFYQPGRSLSMTNGGNGQAHLAETLAAEVRDKILPAYRELQDFLRHEYLPRARATVGLAALPLGDEWYRFLVRRETGTTMTPKELHDQGVAEVERLKTKMQSLLAETAYSGNAQGYLEAIGKDPNRSFSTPEAVSSYYDEQKTQALASLPTLFTDPPASDFILRRLPEFREGYAAPLTYRRAPIDGKFPAVVLFSVRGLPGESVMGAPARFLREGVPGHHYQLSIQRSRVSLPRFLRFGGDPAFVAGWGLYAASLGEELGLYRDTEAKFQAVLGQLECATGLVIDTGLHGQDWSRQRAIEYLKSVLPVSDLGAAASVDRDLALPAEALACGFGERRMVALRTRAEQALGARFDVHAFHSEVLNHGAIPMDILESEIKRWLDNQR